MRKNGSQKGLHLPEKLTRDFKKDYMQKDYHKYVLTMLQR